MMNVKQGFFVLIVGLSIFGTVPISAQIWRKPKNIRISDMQARDEINFWARQMSEHALFLFLGLEEEPLKGQAYQLHTQWEKFRKSYKNNHRDVLQLLEKLKLFKNKVLATLNKGEWIGWIFPSMVEHMILELNYFANKLHGVKFTVEQEKAFWDKEHEGQSLLTAHLLDPSEKETVKKAFAIAEKFAQKKAMSNDEEIMILLSIKHSKELDVFNKEGQKKAQANKLKSIIHPVLLEHEIREVQRSIQTFERLQKKQSNTTLKQLKSLK